MKTKLLNLTGLRSLLLLACMMLGMSAWGDETGNAKLSWSELNLANQTSVDGISYDLGNYFTVTCNKNNSNTAPAYYTTGTAVRCYATKSTNDGNIITVANKSGYENVFITKVTYNGTHSKKGTTSFSYSGSPKETDATSATYDINDKVTSASATLCETGGSANGQFYFTDITVEYVVVGSTLNSSDLVLSPTSLSFDLYSDSSTKTISFATSSTGEVTVSASDYVTTSVSGNTITVTPIKVTPSAQTITVSQAADNTYASGTATFTVTITDSTPFAGGDVTFDATIDKGNTSAGEGSITKSSVKFACSNGILGNGTEYRLYKNSTTTFSTTQGKITKIVFTGKKDYPISGFGTTEGLVIDGNNGTWTGNATSVSFTASEKQVQATKIVVTIIPEGAVAPPTISGSTPFLGETTVTITAEDGAAIYYTTDGSDPTTSCTPYSAPFTISATTTVKAIAAMDGKTSDVATKAFEKTSSYKLNEISNLTDGNYYFEFEKAIVTYVNGNYAFIEDGNGAILYYKNGHGLTAGQMFNGFAFVTWKIYQGQPEATSFTGLEATTGEAPSPTTMTLAALLADPASNMSKYVKLESVEAVATTDGFNLKQNGKEIAFYGRNEATVEAEKTYDVIGFLSKHNDNYQFTVFTPDHIIEVGGLEKSETPTITIADGENEAKVVTIAAATGATIYYTTDGTTPTEESDVYSSALTFNEPGSYTVKAVAMEEGKALSLVASETFTVEVPNYIVLEAGYTETINSFPSFSGSGYKTIDDYPIKVNGIAYKWSVTDGMLGNGGLQLKASTGKLVSPEIRTPHGYTVTVNYTSQAEMTLTSGEATATGAVTDEEFGIHEVTLTVESDAAAFTLAVGSKYAIVNSITITALSTPIVTYTITFHNGEDTKTQTVNEGEETKLEANTFEKEGYVFIGWNTKEDGTGDSYPDEGTITPSEDLDLYAQWQMLGDVNGDEEVTITDVVAIINYLLDPTSAKFNEAAANVDGQDGVTLADALAIINMIIGKQ